MGLFNNWQLLIIRLLCFLGWFSSFAFAQYDISEGVSGMLNFPTLGVTCLGNLSVFVTALIRGRLDVEIGARDVLDILSSPKLNKINGIQNGKGLTTCTEEEATQTAPTEEGTTQAASTEGLHTEVEAIETNATEEEATQTAPTEGLHTDEEEGLRPPSTERGLQTASVLMLSYGTPNFSVKDFMTYNAPIVDSILLHFLPLRDIRNDADVTKELTPEVILERCREHSCNCIVFWTVEEITSMLALRMPGTLKQLSNSLCLLPCLTCHRNGCHGCNQEGLLRVEQSDEGCRARESDSKVVSKLLDEVSAGIIRAGDPICICIPMNDKWTELLVRSFRSKDAEGRGVRVMASEALEGYLAGGRGGAEGTVEYNILSYIVPRFIEVLINCLLTLCFGVDGFSSSLIARRAVRDYVVDSKGSGLAANAFLTKAVVNCDANNTSQVLTFRTNLLGIRSLSVVVGCVNLLSSIVWALLISFEGGADGFPPLSTARLDVITAFILIAGVMDETTLIISSLRVYGSGGFLKALPVLIRTHLILPVLLTASTILRGCIPRTLHARFMSLIQRGSSDPIFMRRALSYPGLKMFVLVFICVLYLEALMIPCVLDKDKEVLVLRSGRGEKYYGRWIYAVLQGLVWLKWAVGSYIINFEKSLEFTGKSPHTWGILVHSSAFMLNAVTAGVRVKWKLWPWKHHHLVPRKLGP